ncbi:MAG TPA: pyruvate dehydrogenase (acetyl-transferring) E1 component subunit alpha [Flavobacteriales bacterium]|nr:pyruvate dehydrogenase (acetyl-transferring) E1 component subunit alpha [Flavobacteriales bacterium]HQV74320.1 pyruvate dehydrogenase (acetyl-transferring) E1 component subunit alpha [Flavobacteriales bacterium]HQW40108.1 pyruvate dehydrogenase (acetyl-transferring) E1 component subunit alpha [Flavobacteriales bacterium]
MPTKTAAANKSEKSPKSEKSAATNGASFSKETYLRWFKEMVLMRRFEEKTGQLYTMQKFGGFCHLYIGQEAILAGMITAIRTSDRIITGYRDHCHPLVLGVPAKNVMAELFGKITGTSKGKGGSMHYFDKQRNLFGGHGIVGGQIGLGAGIAFADKYRGEDHVTLCMMGDGAARQGILHETFNMAMTWKLPVIFIIENNNYAMGTSVERTSNVHDLSTLGESYDMPGKSVNGMKCEDVHEAIAMACEHIRAGNGPYLLDIKTYRYKGHSMSDPQKYRTKEEVEGYKKQDPIEEVRTTILAKKWATEADLEMIDDEVKKEVEAAVKFAQDSPMATEEELYMDVYTQKDYPFEKD